MTFPLRHAVLTQWIVGAIIFWNPWDHETNILYALGYLAIYLVWFGFTVKKIPKLIADAEALTKQNTRKARSASSLTKMTST